MEEVKVILNNEEAKLFMRFREYQEVWEKVFKIKTGKAILHFGNNELKKVEYVKQETLDKELK